jgi:hypothetical protein
MYHLLPNGDPSFLTGKKAPDFLPRSNSFSDISLPLELPQFEQEFGPLLFGGAIR